MGALLIFGAAEEAALVRSEFDDVSVGSARADDRPGVSVQIVLHVCCEIFGGRDVGDFGQGRGDAVGIVESETNLDTGFVAAGLLCGAAGKEADGIGAPL